MVEIVKEKLDGLRRVVLEYFRERLNRRWNFYNLVPTTEVVACSPEVSPTLSGFGNEGSEYLDVVIQGLEEDGIIRKTKCSKLYSFHEGGEEVLGSFLEAAATGGGSSSAKCEVLGGHSGWECLYD